MVEDIARYRTNFQDEIDSAALYRALGEVESQPQLAEVYRRLAEVEDRHAIVADTAGSPQHNTPARRCPSFLAPGWPRL